MAARKVPLDLDRIAELAEAGASTNEIALLIGCDDQTLHRRCAKLIAQKKAERRVQLRAWQSEQAKAGNPSMLIWLGKNELGQRERPDPSVTKVIVKYADRGLLDEDREAREESREEEEERDGSDDGDR